MIGMRADGEQGVMAGWWLRDKAGYEWRTDLEVLRDRRLWQFGRDPAEPPKQGEYWLVPRRGEVISYPMLRSRKMLDQFVEIGRSLQRDRTLRLIANFATNFGLLGQGEPLVPENANPALHVQLESGEPFDVWVKQAQMVAGFYQLGEWITRGQVSSLRPFVEWREHDVTVMIPFRAGYPDASLSTRALLDKGEEVSSEYEFISLQSDLRWDPHGICARWKRPDPIAPVNNLLHLKVSEVLGGHINRAVVPHLSSEIRYFPDSLRTAIWVQLQNRLVATGGREVECANPRCRQKTFVQKRRDQRFCSKSCRNAFDYANRRDKETKHGSQKKQR